MCLFLVLFRKTFPTLRLCTNISPSFSEVLLEFHILFHIYGETIGLATSCLEAGRETVNKTHPFCRFLLGFSNTIHHVIYIFSFLLKCLLNSYLYGGFCLNFLSSLLCFPFYVVIPSEYLKSTFIFVCLLELISGPNHPIVVTEHQRL